MRIIEPLEVIDVDHGDGEPPAQFKQFLVKGPPSGKPCQIVGSAQDITEQKWFEEQIAEQITWVNEAIMVRWICIRCKCRIQNNLRIRPGI